VPVVVGGSKEYGNVLTILFQAHLKDALPVQEFFVSIFTGKICRTSSESGSGGEN
jgi:hypothetical protein